MDEAVLIAPPVELAAERYARLGPYHCRGCGERMRKWRPVKTPDMPKQQGRCPRCVGALFASERPVREVDRVAQLVP